MKELKNEILKNAGLNEEVLEEGIVFFKDSQKIASYLKKLRGFSSSIKHNSTKSYVMSIFSDLNSLRRQLSALEEKYSASENIMDKKFFKDEHRKISDRALNIKDDSRNRLEDLLQEIGREKGAGRISEIIAVSSAVLAVVAFALAAAYFVVMSEGRTMDVRVFLTAFSSVFAALPFILTGSVAEGISIKKKARAAIGVLTSKIPEVANFKTKINDILY
jgi:hypothetical protein